MEIVRGSHGDQFLTNIAVFCIKSYVCPEFYRVYQDSRDSRNSHCAQGL